MHISPGRHTNKRDVRVQRSCSGGVGLDEGGHHCGAPAPGHSVLEGQVSQLPPHALHHPLGRRLWARGRSAPPYLLDSKDFRQNTGDAHLGVIFDQAQNERLSRGLVRRVCSCCGASTLATSVLCAVKCQQVVERQPAPRQRRAEMHVKNRLRPRPGSLTMLMIQVVARCSWVSRRPLDSCREPNGLAVRTVSNDPSQHQGNNHFF